MALQKVREFPAPPNRTLCARPRPSSRGPGRPVPAAITVTLHSGVTTPLHVQNRGSGGLKKSVPLTLPWFLKLTCMLALCKTLVFCTLTHLPRSASWSGSLGSAECTAHSSPCTVGRGLSTPRQGPQVLTKQQSPAVGPRGQNRPGHALGVLPPVSNLAEAGPRTLAISSSLNLRPRRSHIDCLNMSQKELKETPEARAECESARQPCREQPCTQQLGHAPGGGW